MSPLVSVRAVSKHFPKTRAVDGVSFDIMPGETLGLVGESGSGKSTLGRVVVGLLRATAGETIVDGQDVGALRGGARRALWRHAQMVFQDPYSSLNPRMTVRDALAEPLAQLRHRARRRGRRADRQDARCLRPAGKRGDPLSARVLRRPAPAHRHRPRADRAAQLCRRRRAGVGARRLDPGADHQPAAGPEERVRAHLPLHRPRPRRDPPCLRSRRSDVSRQAGRDRAGRDALFSAAPSLHASSCCARCRCPIRRPKPNGAATPPVPRWSMPRPPRTAARSPRVVRGQSSPPARPRRR